MTTDCVRQETEGRDRHSVSCYFFCVFLLYFWCRLLGLSVDILVGILVAVLVGAAADDMNFTQECGSIEKGRDGNLQFIEHNTILILDGKH